jgi:hypothetical protein
MAVRLPAMTAPDADPLARPAEAERRWRRLGCLAALVGSAVALLSAVVAVLVLGPDDDAVRVSEPCDLLEIQLAYLEGATLDERDPAADLLTDDQLATEVERVRRRLDELDC